ncbi:MAG: YfiR family protein [Ferruginibacter sp.]
MLKRISFLLLLSCFIKSSVVAQANQESSLKAVFIYNFTKYIEWDNLNSENNFIIGIMGSSSVDLPMEAIAKNNLIKNKKIIFKHFSSPEDISYCHILFIPRDFPISIKSVSEKVDKKVLVIAEKPGASRQGASINFIIVNDKLKFEISQDAMSAAGLKASSQLLKLAIITDYNVK